MMLELLAPLRPALELVPVACLCLCPAAAVLRLSVFVVQVAGWVGIWTAFVAWYCATAILTGEVWNYVSPTLHLQRLRVQSFFSLCQT